MQNRRDLLKLTAAAPLLLGGSSLLGTLASMPARAVDTSGYRALVCVFLYGGMDCHDTVLPYDLPSWNSYADIRATLLQAYAGAPGGASREREFLLPLNPLSPNPAGGREFALPPEMSALHQLFHEGHAAIVGNVGPLLQPTNRQAFETGGVPLPKRLFSHNDQQSTWMSFAPEGSQLGWGGRFGDAAVAAGANAEAIFSQISLFGNAVFLAGNLVTPYQIGIGGVPSIALMERTADRAPWMPGLLRDHFTSAGAERDNLFERDFIDISRVSFDANDKLDEALQGEPAFETVFPPGFLGGQLGAVARTIAVRDELGASRQVFFVGLGGFDTHSAQATTLPALQQEISDSLAAFYQAMQELGLAESVTAFTASDFGRTLTVNGDGSDHGWGAHQFVVGGAVKGGEIYGTIPEAELGHEQDAGNGRLIPTTAVEQYAGPLGAWYGLDAGELAQALPGLVAFPAGMLDYI